MVGQKRKSTSDSGSQKSGKPSRLKRRWLLSGKLMLVKNI